jgi:carotenoid cleavage dioxygenase-like enzyme
VPAAAATAEDDGWLMTFVTDLRTQTAELWIIDARDMGPPIAAIEIPAWVPAGVHGSWIDDAEI